MKAQDFPVIATHGELSQAEREEMIGAFRSGSVRILITTDLLARGIDIQQVSVVINYDIPRIHENYMHRIGRCGRYGRKGLAISLANENEMRDLHDLEREFSMEIKELPRDVQTLL